MKLWSDRLLVLLGSTNLWTRSRNEYPLDGLSWRRWCNTCWVLFLIAEKNSSSALSHTDENVFQICRTKTSSLGSFEESIISIPLRCIQKSTPCRGTGQRTWVLQQSLIWISFEGRRYSFHANELCGAHIQRASARTQNFRYMIPHGKCTSNCDTEYFNEFHPLYSWYWRRWVEKGSWSRFAEHDLNCFWCIQL